MQFPEESRRTDIPYSARIQDVYSLRCAPQVYGPVFDALDYIDNIVDKEINSATDNPLIFDKEGGGFEIISGGNFHGQYLAQAMDLMAMAITDLGSICERRVARLIDPTLSWGLPRNLMSGVRGVNTGYPVVQCSLSSLVMENRTLCMPGSVDSIPAKGNSEGIWVLRGGVTPLPTPLQTELWNTRCLNLPISRVRAYDMVVRVTDADPRTPTKIVLLPTLSGGGTELP